jgi:hypothetical protein
VGQQMHAGIRVVQAKDRCRPHGGGRGNEADAAFVAPAIRSRSRIRRSPGTPPRWALASIFTTHPQGRPFDTAPS